MSNKIRILLADDHTLLRNGIRALLENEPDISIVGEAEDGRNAIKLAGQLKPDVILMDIAMPLLNGLEATRQIKREHPEVNVLVLTMYDHEEYFRQIEANLPAVAGLVRDTFDSPAGNEILSNYEAKFVKEGRSIYRIAVRKV